MRIKILSRAAITESVERIILKKSAVISLRNVKTGV